MPPHRPQVSTCPAFRNTQGTTADMTQTTVMQQRKGSISLRTTIPEGYATMLSLKQGDKLDWTHEIVNNEVIIKIRKAEK